MLYIPCVDDPHHRARIALAPPVGHGARPPAVLWPVVASSLVDYRALEEAVFTDRLHCRWDELRRGDFSDAALTTRIADLQATLAEAQARNFEKWPILRRHVWPNPVISGSWEAEVERMRAWILSRTAWMDRAIASMPHSGGGCE